MFSPKDLSAAQKKQLRAFESESMDIQCELEQGTNAEYQMEDGWVLPEAFKRKLFDQKHIVKAFVVGLLTAQRWDSPFYKPPEGFEKTVESIANSVQTLRFDNSKGRIRMSVNELVDKHMRIWIQQDENCQRWIAEKVLDPECILRSACEMLFYERKQFMENFRGALTEARNQLAEEEEGKGGEPPPEAPPKKPKKASASSGMHSAV